MGSYGDGDYLCGRKLDDSEQVTVNGRVFKLLSGWVVVLLVGEKLVEHRLRYTVFCILGT